VTVHPDDAVSMLRKISSDVCLLDRSFPDTDGLDHIGILHETAPSCKILLLSAKIDAETVARGVAGNVAGFARKQQPISELLLAIDRVGAGEMSLPSDVLVSVLSSRFVRQRTRLDGHDVRDSCRFLTSREREVLQSIVLGQNTAYMAASLGISATTARGHIKVVLTKLGVNSRLKAAALAVREGVVAAESGEWILSD
jgi:two-component system nitrate/nitrite response regulator NarL